MFRVLNKWALIVTGVAAAAACASQNGVVHTSSVPNAELADVPDFDNVLDSRPLRIACQSEDGGMLQGRGAAASLGSSTGLTATGTLLFNRMFLGLSPAIALADRHALEIKVQDVLENDSDGRRIEWISPNSGQSVVLEPDDSFSSFRIVMVPRAEEVGRTPDSFRVERGSFVTLRQSALRPSPTIAGDVRIDDVPEGQEVEIYGRVRGLYGEDWYMVGNDGRAYGYMEPVSLRPTTGSSNNQFRRTTGSVVRDVVNATIPCRRLTVSTETGNRLIESCRFPDGVWFSDAEQGRDDDRFACLPQRTNGSFIN